MSLSPRPPPLPPPLHPLRLPPPPPPSLSYSSSYSFRSSCSLLRLLYHILHQSLYFSSISRKGFTVTVCQISCYLCFIANVNWLFFRQNHSAFLAILNRLLVPFSLAFSVELLHYFSIIHLLSDFGKCVSAVANDYSTSHPILFLKQKKLFCSWNISRSLKLISHCYNICWIDYLHSGELRSLSQHLIMLFSFLRQILFTLCWRGGFSFERVSIQLLISNGQTWERSRGRIRRRFRN